MLSFLVMCCALAGCGAPSAQTPGRTEAVTETPVACYTVTPPEYVPGAPLTAEDFSVLVDNRPEYTYPMLSDVAPLLAVLGEPDDISAAPSCVYAGEDKSFEYAAISIYTNPDGDRDIMYEALLYTNALWTPRLIRAGDTRADVEAAYGAPVEEGRYLCYYLGDADDLSSPRILFELTEDGIVKTIDIYHPTNITEK